MHALINLRFKTIYFCRNAFKLNFQKVFSIQCLSGVMKESPFFCMHAFVLAKSHPNTPRGQICALTPVKIISGFGFKV